MDRLRREFRIMRLVTLILLCYLLIAGTLAEQALSGFLIGVNLSTFRVGHH